MFARKVNVENFLHDDMKTSEHLISHQLMFHWSDQFNSLLKVVKLFGPCTGDGISKQVLVCWANGVLSTAVYTLHPIQLLV